MNLRERLDQSLVLLDGAMGTRLQEVEIPASAWPGREGCNEWLNISLPEQVAAVHASFLEAGSDGVETNTFGASPLTLAEYGLGDQAGEINRAAARIARTCADAAAATGRPRFVFGSIGPGTRLATLGQVGWDALVAAYRIQIEGLVEGGVDGLLFETCQDPLQLKAALAAADDVVGADSELVRYVSITIEQTGTMLVGTSVPAITAMLAPYAIDLLGLNCATGPRAMRSHLLSLARTWPGRLGCMPNAGLPVMESGRVRYPMKPDAFAKEMKSLVRDVGISVVGGCCGTTPEHIRRLAGACAGYVPPLREIERSDQVASLFVPVDLDQEPRPLLVGERANATGSRAFRDALLAENQEAAFQILVDQEEAGSHVLDVSCAFAGRDEMGDVVPLVARAARECRVPIMIDSTRADVVEAALKHYGGRAVINSIHFEDGETRSTQVVRLARRFGAALVGLTIDEEGMAMKAERKLAVARRLVEFCARFDLPPGSLLIDPLTFTIGSGDPSLRTAALETVEAIRLIKRELPGARTILGLSNISFGLKPVGRKVLNAVFLHQALKAGLDACIINVAQVTPLAGIPEADRRAAEALLENNTAEGDPLEAFIHHFDDAEPVPEPDPADLPPEQALQDAIIKGRPALLELSVPMLLTRMPAEDVLNEHLIPAMREVGRLFNDGLLQLPFVLKSAEVMKRAVDRLRPHFSRSEAEREQGTLVIGTVAGDVHDIGKNLVDIILSNNGFRVINLGTRVPVDRMLAAVREHDADVLGMSGLLVKSALIMEQNLEAMEVEGLRIPVLLGGAALTPAFVSGSCAPRYGAPVAYCRDAFAGLARMRELAETGTIVVDEAPEPAPPPAPVQDAPAEPVDREGPVPAPPFLGVKVDRELPVAPLLARLNEVALVRGRWEFRRGRLSSDAYRQLIDREVTPRLEALKQRALARDLFAPEAAWGWFRCRASGETLWVDPGEGRAEIEMTFPRQRQAPFRSIPDFFHPDRDVVGFMAVTLGPAAGEEGQRLIDAGHYQDYLLLHGFAVELTDALAEFCHERMREEIGFPDEPLTIQDYVMQQYRGSRYGFGYPACPDLAMNRICCDLLQTERIGITLSESDMMIPEMSTCALVAHHPQAKYFFIDP